MKRRLIISSALVVLAIFGCKKKDTTPTTPTNPYMAEAKQTYVNIAFAVYNDAYLMAVQFNAKVDSFITNPTDAGLQDLKQAWIAGRESYSQSETFRFSDGPIDGSNGYETYINSWPVDESFIDYVVGNLNSGIINDPVTYPTISADVLINSNGAASETEVTIGYHAVEFLLWGQDFNANGPGNRSYEDYVDGSTTASNPDRRRTYLSVCSTLLMQMLKSVSDAWDPSITGNYRATMLGFDDKTFLQKAFNQMAVFSHNELAGQRLYAAYDSKDQEDEHSCFSDNTHRDIILMAEGVQNLFVGTYTRTDGTIISGASIFSVVENDYEADAEAAQALIDASVMYAGEIYSPFDQAILFSDPKILQTVLSLQAQGEKLVAIAAKYGITINL